MRRRQSAKGTIGFKKQAKNVKSGGHLLPLTILLVVLGLIAIADSSAPLALNRFSDRFFFVKQQAIWAFIGVVLMIIVSKVRYKFWEQIATPFFLFSLLGLLLVFIPGLGTKVLGARRWVDLGFTTFQPSEIVKLAIIIFIAKVSSKDKPALAFFVPLVLVCGLVMLQPDLGTTLIIVGTVLAQIFVSGVNPMILVLSGLVGGVLAFILIITSDYRRDRLVTFLQQAEDPLNKGYHIRQVLLALGSGGVFGVGLGQSRQKFLFLPETATDSIFAIIAEEFGFIGASFLIILFLSYIILGFYIAKNAPDKFSKILAVGIVAWISTQTFLNIASMVALVPLTGIPLPFISFGGTSLVMMLIATGILKNISNNAK